MIDAPPFFDDGCFGKLDAAVKAATDAGVWVVLADRSEYGAGQEYLTDPGANVFHNATLRGMMAAMWTHVTRGATLRSSDTRRTT